MSDVISTAKYVKPNWKKALKGDDRFGGSIESIVDNLKGIRRVFEAWVANQAAVQEGIKASKAPDATRVQRALRFVGVYPSYPKPPSQ